MKRIFLTMICAFAALSTASPAWADTASTTASASAPVRHLTYSFTYGTQQSASARDTSTISQGSNISHYNGSSGDKGTIAVDLVRLQADKGLIVAVSEQAENQRSAPPATCVVYANTYFICDPAKTVNSEELTLLRFLSPTFVDPNQIDAKSHWSINYTPGMIVKADYTIGSNNNGVMAIDESRTIAQSASGRNETDVQTKIGYDFNRAVPTTVDEYVTQRTDSGMSGTSTTIYQTTLKLQSDSMAKTLIQSP